MTKVDVVVPLQLRNTIFVEIERVPSRVCDRSKEGQTFFDSLMLDLGSLSGFVVPQ